MKKGILVLMLLSMLVGFQSHLTISATDPVLTIFTDKSYFVEGRNFVSDVKIKHASDLAGFQIRLSYDDSLYMLEETSTELTGLFINDAVSGLITVTFADVQNPLEGESVLFSIEFSSLEDLSLGDDRVLLEKDADYDDEFVVLDSENNVSTSEATYELGVNQKVLLGDANLDNKLSIFDVTLMQMELVDLYTHSVGGAIASDLTGQGDTSLTDVLALQIYLTGLTETLIIPTE